MRIGYWLLSCAIAVLAIAGGCSEKRDPAADSGETPDAVTQSEVAAGSGVGRREPKLKFAASAAPPPNPLFEPPEWSFAGSGDTQPLRPRPGTVSTPLLQDEVKRGDLYYVLNEQRILNLSPYRGLQIIDVSNVNQPRVEGQLRLAGEPVELYVIGDRVLVLYNDATEWHGSTDNAELHIANSAELVSVDIRDRSRPRTLARTTIADPIVTSRVVVRGGKVALFVLAGNKAQASLTSYDVTSGALVAKGELDLGEGVRDFDATLEKLMIVGESGVTLVDISKADGSMLPAGEVVPRGMVHSRFDVAIFSGKLRVASSGYSANYLQTYSLVNGRAPELLATCELPERSTDDRSAISTTLMLEDRAFIVSEYEPNALSAVSIAEDGQCEVHPSFMSSGRDAFLRPVLKETRLLGIGADGPMQRSRLTLSLYKATKLDNPMPLAARADIELEDNGSPSTLDKPTWDEHAFTIQEDVVSASAADGTPEHGLVLLPHSTLGTGVAETQIITFSDGTLTKRSSMNHGTPVKSAFQVRGAMIANLSDEQLSLFDATDLDAVREVSRVDLAPDYSSVLVYGDRVARVCEPLVENESAKVQIVDRAGDLDGDSVLTSFEVARGSTFYKVGQLMAAMSILPVGKPSDDKYQTQLQVYDLTDPERPKQRGKLESDRFDTLFIDELRAVGLSSLADDSSSHYGGAGGGGSQSFVTDHAIALISTVPHQKVLGEYKKCVRTPPNNVCVQLNTGKCRTPYFDGKITCITPKGGKEACTGAISLCEESGCKQQAELPADTTQECDDLTDKRAWQSFKLDTIDLQNPDEPVLHDRVELPEDEEATSALADGNLLYLNYQKPTTTAGATRVYVDSYTRQLDFRDPSHVAMREAINLPGRLIYARDELLYTESYEWDGDARRTVISRLTLDGELVQLQATQSIGERHVSYIRFDDSRNHVLLSTDTPADPTGDGDRRLYQLMVLDAQSLEVVSDTDLNVPVKFIATAPGRAIFNTESGLVVYDVEDAAHVRVAAYYQTSLRSSALVGLSDSEVIFAAGVLGVQRLKVATTE